MMMAGESGVSKEGLCMEPGRISAIWRGNLGRLVDRFRTNEMESSISISELQPPTWISLHHCFFSKLSCLEIPSVEYYSPSNNIYMPLTYSPSIYFLLSNQYFSCRLCYFMIEPSDKKTLLSESFRLLFQIWKVTKKKNKEK